MTNVSKPVITETKRDLAADLALCEAATPGPVDYFASIDSEYEYEVCRKDFLDTMIASVIDERDAIMIAEAFEGWPHAIRRAMAAEKEAKQNLMWQLAWKNTAKEWEETVKSLRSKLHRSEAAVRDVGYRLAVRESEVERLTNGVTRLRDQLICDLDALQSGDTSERSAAYEDCIESTLRRIDRYILSEVNDIANED